MYRDKHRGKHRNANIKKRKPLIKKPAFKHKFASRPNERGRKPTKAKEKKPEVHHVSEESSDEPDQFTDFLSTFNVQLSNNARDTDSDDSDETEEETMETANAGDSGESEMSANEDLSDNIVDDGGTGTRGGKSVRKEEEGSDSEISVYEGDGIDVDIQLEADSTSVQQTNDSSSSDSEISVHVPASDDSDIDIPPQSSSNEDDDVMIHDVKVKESNVNDAKPEPDNSVDPFKRHFQYDLDPGLLKSVTHDPPIVDTYKLHWPVLDQLYFLIPKSQEHGRGDLTTFLAESNVYASVGTVPNRINTVDLPSLHIRSEVIGNINIVNPCKTALTSLQKELFSIINCYQDLFFPSRTLENGEEIRFVYCLHAVNHILKARKQVTKHNKKIEGGADVSDNFRDQGLVRPRVLIVVPFKDSALRVVKFLTSLLYPKDKGNIMKKSRFIEEYTGNELTFPTAKPKPEDYEQTFRGNVDDNFRIGLSLTKKCVKLYVDFYKADILVASPMGLRLIIGAEGEENRDYDFLASIEVLVIDQCEIFMMQNWEHVLHLMEHLHLQPRESHGTDFSRVRSWSLNGQTRYYRQTLVFSSLVCPEINALFNKKCHNYAGKVRVAKHISLGSMSQVLVQFPQVFHRFSASEGKDAIANRMNFFCKKILPQYLDCLTNHVLVFIPSYYDYVRLRNYFKREDISFVQICEYTKDDKIARARDLFYHNEAHFLLYTERAHFFRRLRIKGIRHLIFYQLPVNPHFYSELCNFMQSGNSRREHGDGGTSPTITVLYSKCDALQLAAVVGTEKTARMLQSEGNVHLFVTE